MFELPTELPFCAVPGPLWTIVRDTKTRHMEAPRTGTRTVFAHPLTEKYRNVPADKTAKIGKMKFILASKIDTWRGPSVHRVLAYPTVKARKTAF